MSDKINCTWKAPFVPDDYTVALYHFDEGRGGEAHDACGDPALTLRAKEPLWSERPGFGSAVRFTRREDDANVFVGPVNHDKLQLRTCREEWTIEAWVRYTGMPGQDDGHTYANICATDEEGLSLPEGARGGWTFSLLTAEYEEGLRPWGRFIGPFHRPKSGIQTAARMSKVSDDYKGEVSGAILDQNWHHVAWQFRYRDQQHFLFLDGKLIWKLQRPRDCEVVNEPRETCIPFMVGGFLHSQNPPFYLGYGNFEGEIDELRISNVMRYPVADQLTIIRRTLPEAAIQGSYCVTLETDGAVDPIHWEMVKGKLPKGLEFDGKNGNLHGRPEEPGENKITLQVRDQSGRSDEHEFTIKVCRGEIVDTFLPLAFTGLEYQYQFTSSFLVKPIRWNLISDSFPEGFSFDSSTGALSGKPVKECLVGLAVKAQDACGQTVRKEFTLRTVPTSLRRIDPDDHTVVLYDWQGPSGKFIRDVKGDEELTLTWTNMFGDIRYPRPGWGRYPVCEGGGEWGFVGPQHNDKLNLRTCGREWTVEAWVRRGGPINRYDQPFDFGHICGTYDATRRGVWELYMAYDGSPDGAMAPGVHFVDAAGGQEWMDLHPWKRPEGVVLAKGPAGQVIDRRYLGIRDTEWHHVAWQYSYGEDLHQLFLDGTLIWKMANSGGRPLVNNRRHEAQFSVGTRLNGYARYGGSFNWLGWGNFFGQIGEIRISDIRRY
jgi:hypothetical protein